MKPEWRGLSDGEKIAKAIDGVAAALGFGLGTIAGALLVIMVKL